MAYDRWGGSWGSSWGLSWTGEEVAPPTPDPTDRRSSAGGKGRVYSTRGISIPPPNPRKRKLPEPVIEAIPEPVEHKVTDLGKLAKVIPIRETPKPEPSPPLTLADAQSLIAEAIERVEKQLAEVKAQEAQATELKAKTEAELKTLKYLEEEEERVLSAKQIECLLLLALVE